MVPRLASSTDAVVTQASFSENGFETTLPGRASGTSAVGSTGWVGGLFHVIRSARSVWTARGLESALLGNEIGKIG